MLEVTDADTRFIPIVDVGRLALYGLMGLFLVIGALRAYLRYLERGRH